MLVTIPDVLSKDEIRIINDLMKAAEFHDGTVSAGSESRRVKNNEEMNLSEKDSQRLNNVVMGKLVQNPTYIAAAFASRIAAPYYAKYTSGMYYGNHVDDPVMGPAHQRYRADISITIFLNEPEEYDGGELVVQTPFGEQLVKLPAGSAVMYPSGSTHRVAEVTRGERLVAVTWLQSSVRDPARREVLYKLAQVRDSLIASAPDSEELEKLSYSYINLLRMWTDL